jgi:SAM-dependent methyltransferase
MLSRLRSLANKCRMTRRNGWASFRTPEFLADIAHNSRRWDDEWLSYWVTEKDYAHKYFINRRSVDRQAAEEHLPHLKSLSEEQFYASSPMGQGDFAIWVKGEWVPDATIVELGCGPGLLGKAIAPFCRQYIGIDYSRLALHVAQLTSPANCRYLHLSELKELKKLAGKCDLCVGRYFFIHQNWKNATWVLKLYRLLLRPGGSISADFFARGEQGTEIDNSWMIRNPAESLDEEYPSCMFQYTDEHIHRLAKECNLTVERIDFLPALQRRFSVFAKHV